VDILKNKNAKKKRCAILFSMNTLTTRIAPSPTGLFHIGSARTALFNYLFAKKMGGRFIVRIEDTDKERSKKEYEENILEGLKCLGLSFDDFYRQSEHKERHKELLLSLVKEGKAYLSKEPMKNDPEKMIEVVRLKNEGISLTFSDTVRGEITFETKELGDIVLARTIDDPLYHFAVVVDDYDEGVSHIIRGEDHISNTPRHILIMNALSFPIPKYTHLPLILSPDRSKMSKRHGAVAVSSYFEEGFSSTALINYLALLGWNAGNDKEMYSLSELIEAFSLEGIQKSGAVFSREKLEWFEKSHREKRKKEEVRADFLSAIAGHSLYSFFSSKEKALDDALLRFVIKGDFKKAVEEGEYSFYEKEISYSPSLLIPKKGDSVETKKHLQEILSFLGTIAEEAFLSDIIKKTLWDYAEKEGKGLVLWPLRVALSGKEKSPDPFLISESIGKEKTKERIENALLLL
jgi:glutamyl-tRNA synthetase